MNRGLGMFRRRTGSGPVQIKAWSPGRLRALLVVGVLVAGVLLYGLGYWGRTVIDNGSGQAAGGAVPVAGALWIVGERKFQGANLLATDLGGGEGEITLSPASSNPRPLRRAGRYASRIRAGGPRPRRARFVALPPRRSARASAWAGALGCLRRDPSLNLGRLHSCGRG